MQSIIPAGLHTLPLLEAELTVVAPCSVHPWLSLCPAQVPSLCATFLFKRAFSEDHQFSALKRPLPFSPPIPVNLFCPLRGRKHIVQEHRFQRKISKQQAVLLLYQKLSWIMESLMGLNRSWRVAWALTDAAVYCVVSVGVPVCWGHLTLCRYFETLVEVGMLMICHRERFCSCWQMGKTPELHSFSPPKACDFSTTRWSNLGKGQRNRNISKISLLRFPREEFMQNRSHLLLRVSTGKSYSCPLFSSPDSWCISELWFLELYK